MFSERGKFVTYIETKALFEVTGFNIHVTCVKVYCVEANYFRGSTSYTVVNELSFISSNKCHKVKLLK
jgi:hypothetical protein